jgi:hypothetical protein
MDRIETNDIPPSTSVNNWVSDIARSSPCAPDSSGTSISGLSECEVAGDAPLLQKASLNNTRFILLTFIKQSEMEMQGFDTLPAPNNPQEASHILAFVRATRDICSQEKSLAEQRLERHRLGYKIYRHEIKKAGIRLLAAEGEVGKARSYIRSKGWPVSPYHISSKHTSRRHSQVDIVQNPAMICT